MPDPILSALITTWNGGPYLAPAVQSILAQTYRDFELVVVDDGSTDGSAAVLDAIAARDERVRVLHRPHEGIPKSANAGLAACRGQYIARMDGDDLAYPDRFAVQLDYLRDSGCVCVGCYVDYMDDAGRHLTTIKSPTDHDTISATLLKGHCAIWHTGSMFTRAAIEQVNGYDEQFDCALDLDLWLRLGEVGRLGNVPQALQRYRLHANSVSEQKRVRQRERCRFAAERAAARRGVPSTFVAADAWRPGSDRASKHHFALQYGWWAFNSGERATAMHYARRALAQRPASTQAWKLLACAALKKPAAPREPRLSAPTA